MDFFREGEHSLSEFREAMLWEPAGGSAVKCNLCAHRCQIAAGEPAHACREALSAGTIRSEVVLNLIARELDPPAIDPVSTPEKLCLREEPFADCARYDALRQEVVHASQ